MFQWSQWTPCNADCGRGMRLRDTRCAKVRIRVGLKSYLFIYFRSVEESCSHARVTNTSLTQRTATPGTSTTVRASATWATPAWSSRPARISAPRRTQWSTVSVSLGRFLTRQAPLVSILLPQHQQKGENWNQNVSTFSYLKSFAGLFQLWPQLSRR